MSICPIRGHMLAARTGWKLARWHRRWSGSSGRQRLVVLTPTLERTMSKQTKPSIVFVHGLWTDGNKHRTVQPDMQRFVAKRMGASVFETHSSHVPILPHPHFVLAVIRQPATTIHPTSQST